MKLVVFAAAVLSLLAFVGTQGRMRFVSQASLGNIVRITPPKAGNVTLELWAYAKHTDGDHLIACGMMQSLQDNVMGGYLYRSLDGGMTWHRALFDNSTRWVSEENCTYGSGRKTYFASSASNYYNGQPHHETGHLRVYASNDDGVTFKHVYTHPYGFIDWTYLVDAPSLNNFPEAFLIFGNAGTDRLGHWKPQRPVALESTDGGHTFSGLFTPPDGLKYRYVFFYGNAILSDGTVLLVASDRRRKSHVKTDASIDVFAYVPRDTTFRLRSTIETYTEGIANPFGSPALAQDQSKGRFKGRLYAAWTMTDLKGQGDRSYIRLAISDDGGIHWSSRNIESSEGIWSPSCRRKSIFDEIHVAVSPEGILGLLWVENGRDVLFASSRDRGQSFSPTAVIAIYTQSPDMLIAEALPHDNYSFDDYAASRFGLSTNEPPRWDSSLGLTVTLGSSIGRFSAAESALAVDAQGVFHAFWLRPRGDGGGNALFTRRIAPSTSDGSNRVLDDSTAPSTCMLIIPKQIRPTYPRSSSVIVPQPGEREVTSSLRMRLLRSHYDALSHTITVDAQVTNIGKKPLRNPLLLAGTNLRSDFGIPIAANAAAVLSGNPVWYANEATISSGFAPKAQSAPVHFVFRIVKFHVPFSIYYAFGNGITMKIHAYERLKPKSH